MHWQPIEDAPRDGTLLLVNDTTEGMAPWVAAKYQQGDAWSGWVYDDDILLDCNPCGPNPTHFLPLPPPPVKEGE